MAGVSREGNQPLRLKISQVPINIDELLQHRDDLLPRRIHFVRLRRADRQQEDLQKRFVPINRLLPFTPAASTSRASNTIPNAQLDNAVVDPAAHHKKQKSQGELFVDSIVGVPRTFLFPSEKIRETLRWKHIRSVGRGLENLGNTCFFNATLQCLTYTVPLANYLLERQHSQQCPLRQNSSFCLMCLLERHVIEVMSSGPSPSAYRPIPLLKSLPKISKLLRFGRQEDAHEFIRCTLDGIQRSLLRAAVGGSYLAGDFDSREDAKMAAALGPRVAETTFLHAVFGGYLNSQLRCAECSFESNKCDPFLDLSLDLRGCQSLEDCLRNFCKPEILSQNDRWLCDRCHKKTQARKQMSILSCPNILSIQLNRFNFLGQKINKPIRYPSRFEISSFLHPKATKDRNKKEFSYELYAVIVHEGWTSDSGHYYSFAKSSAGIWHEFDDERVSKVSEKTVLLQPSAYILFYSRVPSAPSSLTPTSLSPAIAVHNGHLNKSKKELLQQTASNETNSEKNILVGKKRKELLEVTVLGDLNRPIKKQKTENFGSSSRTIPDSPFSLEQVLSRNSPLEGSSRTKLNEPRTLSNPLLPPALSNIVKSHKVPWSEANSDTGRFEALPVDSWDDSSHNGRDRLSLMKEQLDRVRPQIKKRDKYDLEYDVGNLKKIKTKKPSLFEQSSFNSFQAFVEASKSQKKRLKTKAEMMRKTNQKMKMKHQEKKERRF